MGAPAPERAAVRLLGGTGMAVVMLAWEDDDSPESYHPDVGVECTYVSLRALERCQRRYYAVERASPMFRHPKRATRRC